MKTEKNLGNCFDHYSFGILIAIELLMSFTFLGYIHLSPISVTIAYLFWLQDVCLALCNLSLWELFLELLVCIRQLLLMLCLRMLCFLHF